MRKKNRLKNPYLQKQIYILWSAFPTGMTIEVQWDNVLKVLQMGRNVTILDMGRFPWRNN